MDFDQALRAEASLQQREYERITTELEPVLERMRGTISPILQSTQPELVMLAALIHQAARAAQQIGMSRNDFDKRVSQIADRVFVRRPAVPKIIV